MATTAGLFGDGGEGDAPYAPTTHVQVACRVRPLTRGERAREEDICVDADAEGRTVTVVAPDQARSFKMDYVFDEGTSQADVYERACARIVRGVLDGWNGTILTCGEYRAGMTYTMEGPSVDDFTRRGLLPRALSTIFDVLFTKKTTHECKVFVSYVELYLDSVRDLLNPGSENMDLHETFDGNVFISGCTELPIERREQALEAFKWGKAHRVQAMVDESVPKDQLPRSHGVFIITLTQYDATTDKEISSRLSFVDIAGSERVASTRARGHRLNEARKINTALFHLHQVVSALVERRSHVPYRDSKLTRLLRDAFGGNTQTLMIACCSPALTEATHTQTLLQFAENARRVRNFKAIPDEELPDPKLAEMSSNLQALKNKEGEIERLMASLVGSRVARATGATGRAPSATGGPSAPFQPLSAQAWRGDATGASTAGGGGRKKKGRFGRRRGPRHAAAAAAASTAAPPAAVDVNEADADGAARYFAGHPTAPQLGVQEPPAYEAVQAQAADEVARSRVDAFLEGVATPDKVDVAPAAAEAESEWDAFLKEVDTRVGEIEGGINTTHALLDASTATPQHPQAAPEQQQQQQQQNQQQQYQQQQHARSPSPSAPPASVLPSAEPEVMPSPASLATKRRRTRSPQASPTPQPRRDTGDMRRAVLERPSAPPAMGGGGGGDAYDRPSEEVITENESLRERLARSQDEHRQALEELDRLREVQADERLAALEAENAELMAMVEQMEADAQSTAGELQRAAEAKAQLEEELHVVLEKNAELARLAEDVHAKDDQLAQLADQAQNLPALHAELESARAQVESLTQDLVQQRQMAVSSAEEVARLGTVDEEMDAQRALSEELAAQVHALESELHDKGQQLEGMVGVCDRLANEKTQHEEQLQHTLQRMAALEGDVVDERKKKAEAQRYVQELENTLQTRREELEWLQAKCELLFRERRTSGAPLSSADVAAAAEEVRRKGDEIAERHERFPSETWMERRTRAKEWDELEWKVSQKDEELAAMYASHAAGNPELMKERRVRVEITDELRHAVRDSNAKSGEIATLRARLRNVLAQRPSAPQAHAHSPARASVGAASASASAGSPARTPGRVSLDADDLARQLEVANASMARMGDEAQKREAKVTVLINQVVELEDALRESTTAQEHASGTVQELNEELEMTSEKLKVMIEQFMEKEDHASQLTVENEVLANKVTVLESITQRDPAMSEAWVVMSENLDLRAQMQHKDDQLNKLMSKFTTKHKTVTALEGKVGLLEADLKTERERGAVLQAAVKEKEELLEATKMNAERRAERKIGELQDALHAQEKRNTDLLNIINDKDTLLESAHQTTQSLTALAQETQDKLAEERETTRQRVDAAQRAIAEERMGDEEKMAAMIEALQAVKGDIERLEANEEALLQQLDMMREQLEAKDAMLEQVAEQGRSEHMRMVEALMQRESALKEHILALEAQQRRASAMASPAPAPSGASAVPARVLGTPGGNAVGSPRVPQRPADAASPAALGKAFEREAQLKERILELETALRASSTTATEVARERDTLDEQVRHARRESRDAVRAARRQSEEAGAAAVEETLRELDELRDRYRRDTAALRAQVEAGKDEAAKARELARDHHEHAGGSLADARRRHQKETRAMRHEMDKMREQLGDAEDEAAVLRSRNDALEAQLQSQRGALRQQLHEMTRMFAKREEQIRAMTSKQQALLNKLSVMDAAAQAGASASTRAHRGESTLPGMSAELEHQLSAIHRINHNLQEQLSAVKNDLFETHRRDEESTLHTLADMIRRKEDKLDELKNMVKQQQSEMRELASSARVSEGREVVRMLEDKLNRKEDELAAMRLQYDELRRSKAAASSSMSSSSAATPHGRKRARDSLGTVPANESRSPILRKLKDEKLNRLGAVVRDLEHTLMQERQRVAAIEGKLSSRVTEVHALRDRVQVLEGEVEDRDRMIHMQQATLDADMLPAPPTRAPERAVELEAAVKRLERENDFLRNNHTRATERAEQAERDRMHVESKLARLASERDFDTRDAGALEGELERINSAYKRLRHAYRELEDKMHQLVAQSTAVASQAMEQAQAQTQSRHRADTRAKLRELEAQVDESDLRYQTLKQMYVEDGAEWKGKVRLLEDELVAAENKYGVLRRAYLEREERRMSSSFSSSPARGMHTSGVLRDGTAADESELRELLAGKDAQIRELKVRVEELLTHGVPSGDGESIEVKQQKWDEFFAERGGRVPPKKPVREPRASLSTHEDKDQQINDLQDELKDLRLDYRELDDKVQAMADLYTEVQEDNNEKDQALQAMGNEYKKLENEMDAQRRALSTAQQEARLSAEREAALVGSLDGKVDDAALYAKIMQTVKHEREARKAAAGDVKAARDEIIALQDRITSLEKEAETRVKKAEELAAAAAAGLDKKVAEGSGKVEDQVRALLEEREAQQGELEKMRRQVESLQEEVAEVERQRYELVGESKQGLSLLQLQEEVERKSQELEQMQREMEELRTERADLDARMREYEDLREEVEERKEEVLDREADARRREHRGGSGGSGGGGAAASGQRSAAALRREVADKETTIEQLRGEVAHLRKVYASAPDERLRAMHELQTELAALQAQYEDAVREAIRLRQVETKARATERAAAATRRESMSEVETLRAELRDREDEVVRLRSMVDSEVKPLRWELGEAQAQIDALEREKHDLLGVVQEQMRVLEQLDNMNEHELLAHLRNLEAELVQRGEETAQQQKEIVVLKDRLAEAQTSVDAERKLRLVLSQLTSKSEVVDGLLKKTRKELLHDVEELRAQSVDNTALIETLQAQEEELMRLRAQVTDANKRASIGAAGGEGGKARDFGFGPAPEAPSRDFAEPAAGGGGGAEPEWLRQVLQREQERVAEAKEENRELRRKVDKLRRRLGLRSEGADDDVRTAAELDAAAQVSPETMEIRGDAVGLADELDRLRQDVSAAPAPAPPAQAHGAAAELYHEMELLKRTVYTRLNELLGVAEGLESKCATVERAYVDMKDVADDRARRLAALQRKVRELEDVLEEVERRFVLVGADELDDADADDDEPQVEVRDGAVLSEALGMDASELLTMLQTMEDAVTNLPPQWRARFEQNISKEKGALSHFVVAEESARAAFSDDMRTRALELRKLRKTYVDLDRKLTQAKEGRYSLDGRASMGGGGSGVAGGGAGGAGASPAKLLDGLDGVLMEWEAKQGKRLSNISRMVDSVQPSTPTGKGGEGEDKE